MLHESVVAGSRYSVTVSISIEIFPFFFAKKLQPNLLVKFLSYCFCCLVYGKIGDDARKYWKLFDNQGKIAARPKANLNRKAPADCYTGFVSPLRPGKAA